MPERETTPKSREKSTPSLSAFPTVSLKNSVQLKLYFAHSDTGPLPFLTGLPSDRGSLTSVGGGGNGFFLPNPRLLILDVTEELLQPQGISQLLLPGNHGLLERLVASYQGLLLLLDVFSIKVARVLELAGLDSENEYVKMRLAGKHATFDPTTALNRILAKRLSSATAHDVYNSMAMQLAENDKYQDYLLSGAEDLLKYINERDDAEMVVLTYGEHAFQDAKFTSVVLPLFR